MKILFVCLVVIFSFATTLCFADDFDIISKRLFDDALYNPSKSEVDAVRALLKTNGSFSDLNYSNATPDLSDHLTRILSLAAAYQSVGNTYYHNATIKAQYFSSLQFWVTTNHTPDNWWFREIGYPKTLGLSFILMSVELKNENTFLLASTVSYLRVAYLNNKNMEGANGADKIAGAFPSSVVMKNTAELTKYTSQITSLIVIQNKGEGIEADYLFAAHSIDGRQVYGSYSTEYMQSILNYISYVKGTFCDVSSSTYILLEDFAIEGIQWYMYKRHIDPNQTGRKTSSVKGIDVIPENIKKLVDLQTPRTSLVNAAYDRVLNGAKAATFLSGNKMFWRFDYMIHRRQNYYVSSRMISTRTCGLESGDGDGNNNYYGGSGLNFIIRSGKEYEGNYFTVFNYRQFPGITVEQDNATLPLVDWSVGAGGGNAFAGGVSDGTYGAAGMIHNRRNVTARKSWFYFENEYVALGSGINQTNGTANVFTTLNQALQKGIITYSKNSTQQTAGTGLGSTASANPDWIFQDSIAYINLDATSNFKISSDTRLGTNIFTVGVDHGKNPGNATYSYIVYPNTSITTTTNYKANLPLQILSNTNTVQAVYHKTQKISQVIFYVAGSLTLADGKVITVNAPSAVMIKEIVSGYEITVANPLCEKSNPASLSLTINKPLEGNGVTWNGTVSTIMFALPQGNYAGQSVKKSMTTTTNNTCVPAAASSNDGNLPLNVLDNNLSTRWSADGSGQWIQLCLNDARVIDKVDIAFYSGNARVTTFDLVTSMDQQNWNTALLKVKNSGTSLALERFTFSSRTAKYIRIVGYGNTVNTWNSITEITIPAVTPVNVNPIVNLTAPTTNSSFIAPATISISASASDADGTISKVEFFNGSVWLGEDLTSPYSYNWFGVMSGTYTLSAKASDNTGGIAYSSNVVVNITTAVNQLPLVSLTAPVHNSSFTSPATISIEASASDADGTISKLEFFNGNVWVGEDLTSPYSYNWAGMMAGTYLLSAKATDNAGGIAYSSKVIVNVTTVVNQLPVVSLTAPTDNSSFIAPAAISIAASASDADGVITKVEFFNGAIKLGEDFTSPYTYIWSGVRTGNYTLTVKATDNVGTVSTSAVRSITVLPAATDNCDGLATYTENGNYAAGSMVKQSGIKYQCKPWPYSGWCNGASWAYTPGTGPYWQDAWLSLGSCQARIESINEEYQATKFSCMPNPFGERMSIQFEVEQSDYLVVEITDQTGRKITTLYNGSIEAGLKDVEFNSLSLVSGVYFCKVQLSNGTSIRKIVKL
ncbi:MAG: discoidin domain-containing protein [Cytophagaceae bacterium]|nr:discoidin domain-containing protein [Cytophagaceae bacterium]